MRAGRTQILDRARTAGTCCGQVPVRCPDPVCLVGIELATPLGLDAATTLDEMAAGSLPFRLTEIVDTAGERVPAARLAIIPNSATRAERMSILAAQAFACHLERVSSLGLEAFEQVPLLLALPEGDGFLPIQEALLRIAQARMPRLRLTLPADGAVAEGRAGVFHMLTNAIRRIRTGAAKAVLIGAIDCLCDAISLQGLVAARRTLGPANQDGIIAGEAAGFGLVVCPEVILPNEMVRLIVQGVSIAREKNHFRQMEPNLGHGLTTVFRELRENAGRWSGTAGSCGRPRRVDLVRSCQTGETYWAEEFNYAYLRNASLMPEPLLVHLVAEGLGDVGAAAGMVQLAAALRRSEGTASDGQLRAGPAGSESTPLRTMVYACSDNGQVGACVVDSLGGDLRPFAPDGPCWWTIESNSPPISSTDSMFVPGALRFGRMRCEEHLSEVGFLLHRRLVDFENEELSWTRVSEIDARIEWHLAALCSWGEAALQTPAGAALGLDLGRYGLLGGVFALASLGASPGTKSRSVRQSLRRLKFDPWPQLLRCLSLAFVDDLPVWTQALSLVQEPDVGDQLAPLLGSDRTEVQCAVAHILGYRRQGAEALARQLSSSADVSFSAREVAALALAKMADHRADASLAKLVQDNPDSLPLLEAALCLLGEEGIAFVRYVVRNRTLAASRSYVLLALAGVASDVPILLAAEPKDPAATACLCTALGSLGTIDSIAWLIERLLHAEDSVRNAAARALRRITGAELRERVWLPSPAANEEALAILGGDESSTERDTGNARTGPNSTFALEGTWVERPSTRAERWQEWWSESGRSFQKATRYRRGRLFRLPCCVEEAQAPGTPREERSLAMLELQIRARRATDFEADDWVGRQSAELARCQAWLGEF